MILAPLHDRITYQGKFTPFSARTCVALILAFSDRGIDTEDFHRIAGVQWLCMYPENRFQATIEANALTRSLLVVQGHGSDTEDYLVDEYRKLAAAEALLIGIAPEPPMLPENTPEIVEETAQILENDEVLPEGTLNERANNALKEYEGWKDLLFALQYYMRWRQVLAMYVTYPLCCSYRYVFWGSLVADSVQCFVKLQPFPRFADAIHPVCQG